MNENKEMIEEMGQAAVDEVEKLTFEPITEVMDIPKKGSGSLKKVAIIGAIGVLGTIAGYLYKRYRDRKWMDDFDDGEDEYRPEEPVESEVIEESEIEED